MNAIAPTAPDQSEESRTQRHLRMLRRLTELGMQLAEAAAEKALQEGETQAAIENQTTPEKPADYKPAGPAITFTRLARCVRQCIALEATIAAGNPTLPKRTPYDPRRAPIRRMVDEATSKIPERNEIRREAENLLDQELLADPEQNTPLPDLFHSIVAELGLKIDPATISNQSLNDLCPGIDPLPIRGQAEHHPERTPEELLALLRGDPEPETEDLDFIEPPSPQIPPPAPLLQIPPPPPKQQTFTPTHLNYPYSPFGNLRAGRPP